MKQSQAYQFSQNTPYKQASLQAFLFLHFQLVQNIWQNEKRTKGKCYPVYQYFDLYVGRGIDPQGDAGSPIVFLNAVRDYGIQYHAELFEVDPDNFKELSTILGNMPHVTLQNESNEALISRLKKKPRNIWRYGLVYSDPSNADPAFDVLQAVCRTYPRMEVGINIAATSYKRTNYRDDWVRLNERLLELKKVWLIRKPIGAFQWTILIGSNWNEVPDWQNKDFYRFDSPTGREWFEKIVYTRNERQSMIQLPLFVDDKDA